jgi:hypothetical protein
LHAGNEFNLLLDGCGLGKDEGGFFTTTEGMVFLREYRDVVMIADGSQGVNTGMAVPRSRVTVANGVY